MASPEYWANPVTTRSRVVLEIASELVTVHNPFWQAKVLLRVQGQTPWELALFGSSTLEGVDAVVRGEAALGIINPSTALALAYRGAAPYDAPQPVRTIAVIPSLDQYVFVARADTGLRTFEEIGTKKFPLRVSCRGWADHSLHYMLDHVVEAAGFSLDELRAWGGEVRREGLLPWPNSEKFQALVDGKIDAIFDEASDVWVNEAADAGMTVLPLAESTVQKLEARGFRRALLEKSHFTSLKHDVLTVDFSGWPIFVHAETPDALVTPICAALDARKAAIPWQGQGPLPLERMCREAPDTPQDVPLHPAAERFWRERGYLT
jgi:TRAP-type uncharacterized transport system substrate-binding protein